MSARQSPVAISLALKLKLCVPKHGILPGCYRSKPRSLHFHNIYSAGSLPSSVLTALTNAFQLYSTQRMKQKDETPPYKTHIFKHLAWDGAICFANTIFLHQ